MNDIAKTLGKRIRSYRTSKKLSQEKLAELSGCHPTYIGQLERGEKNATIETISKIASALGIKLSVLFENAEDAQQSERSIPSKCYNLILSKSIAEQEHIYKIILEIEKINKN